MPQFVKSHGLGNDYVVIDPATIPFALTPAVVRLICDRHLGVGSDGILALAPAGPLPRSGAPTPRSADFGLRIFNPDGSEAEKSGNGIRIFAKFLRDHGYTDRDDFVVGTGGGDVRVRLRREAGRVAQVTADIGTARFDPLETIDVDGRRLEVTAVSLGNPHCVVVVPDLAQVDVRALGPKIERHPAFPRRTNVQFAQVLSRREVRIEIWERGAGYTLASGTSSCAVAAACHRKGLVDRDVTVQMPGGALSVAIGDDGALRLHGPVEEICAGDFSPELLRRIATLG